MGDANPIRNLGDYSKPSHEGYRNIIELPEGNNVVPLRSDTIRERTCMRLFQFSLCDQASNWLERLLAGSISTREDLTTRFLAQFFPPGRTTNFRNEFLLFQQHQGESLSKAWTRFKDLLQKVPHHGIDLWLQVQIFYDHIDQTLKRTLDYAAEGLLRKLSAEKAWATIEKLAQYEDEGWNDPVIPKERSLDYEKSRQLSNYFWGHWNITTMSKRPSSTRGQSSTSQEISLEERIRRFRVFENGVHQLNYDPIARRPIHSGDVINWEFLTDQYLDQVFSESINTDSFSRPQ
ncbi:zinc finger, CCHC-type containing protein [Tanacetum coccineum]